jgi:hypothetical protein
MLIINARVLRSSRFSKLASLVLVASVPASSLLAFPMAPGPLLRLSARLAAASADRSDSS